jgi:hypothetical protein
MRQLTIVLGVLAALAGAVWILQGIGMLPGSFMSGDRRWAIIGSITLVAGLALAAWGERSMTS